MLTRFPTLLARPVSEPQYRAKLSFLTSDLGQPLDALERFPQ
jgi:hypothetical protein